MGLERGQYAAHSVCSGRKDHDESVDIMPGVGAHSTMMNMLDDSQALVYCSISGVCYLTLCDGVCYMLREAIIAQSDIQRSYI